MKTTLLLRDGLQPSVLSPHYRRERSLIRSKQALHKHIYTRLVCLGSHYRVLLHNTAGVAWDEELMGISL